MSSFAYSRCEFNKAGLSRSWSRSFVTSQSPVVIYANAVKMLQDSQISLMVDNERGKLIGEFHSLTLPKML